MRVGAPIFGEAKEPEAWAALVKQHGYRAAYCPVDHRADDGTVQAYSEAARRHDIVIAEVGAWSNPLSTDGGKRKEAIAHCQAQLELAERIGARCCVNITGSRGEQWDGPHPANLTPETFDLIVETTREIIDAIKPTRTFYTLETMPYLYPDSPQNYVRLMDAIDRPSCAVHFDPVNLINSPDRYFSNADFLRECFRLLGSRIRSVHAKDVLIESRLLVHINEVRPGLGTLDYGVFLREMDKLDPDTPLMLEHLPNTEEYAHAAAYVREVAAQHAILL
jgi:sugar phosphate isomerase/epimerase